MHINSKSETKEWVILSIRVRSWEKKMFQRILKGCNPADKKILQILRNIDANDPSSWIDFKGRDFKRWISASFEYEAKSKEK